jgi:thioesterase domain-containing protein
MEARMNEWEPYTTGSFRHIYIEGTHAQVLSESNLPLFIELLSRTGVTVMELAY